MPETGEKSGGVFSGASETLSRWGMAWKDLYYFGAAVTVNIGTLAGTYKWVSRENFSLRELIFLGWASLATLAVAALSVYMKRQYHFRRRAEKAEQGIRSKLELSEKTQTASNKLWQSFLSSLAKVDVMFADLFWAISKGSKHSAAEDEDHDLDTVFEECRKVVVVGQDILAKRVTLLQYNEAEDRFVITHRLGKNPRHGDDSVTALTKGNSVAGACLSNLTVVCVDDTSAPPQNIPCVESRSAVPKSVCCVPVYTGRDCRQVLAFECDHTNVFDKSDKIALLHFSHKIHLLQAAKSAILKENPSLSGATMATD